MSNLRIYATSDLHGYLPEDGVRSDSCYNVSRVNENYTPVNPIMEIQIEA